MSFNCIFVHKHQFYIVFQHIFSAILLVLLLSSSLKVFIFIASCSVRRRIKYSRICGEKQLLLLPLATKEQGDILLHRLVLVLMRDCIL